MNNTNGGSMRFSGKTVVVTGAASGIGAATVKTFLSEGANVVLADQDTQGLEAFERESDVDPSRYLCVRTDVSSVDSVAELTSIAFEKFGSIEVVVSNAGIWSERKFLDLTIDEWDRVLNVNLRSQFIVCQAFAREMVARGTRGSMVLTASTNSFAVEPNLAHYNTSKGGVLLLAKSLAVDLAPYNIRVNAIAPGTIRTPITQKDLPEGPTAEFAFPPARRWGEASECASVIAFLASKEASYVMGEAIVVDGGQITLNGVITE